MYLQKTKYQSPKQNPPEVDRPRVGFEIMLQYLFSDKIDMRPHNQRETPLDSLEGAVFQDDCNKTP